MTRKILTLLAALALALPAAAGPGSSSRPSGGGFSGGSSSRPSGGGFSGGSSSRPASGGSSKPAGSGFSGGSSKPPGPLKGVSGSGFSGGSSKPADPPKTVKSPTPLPGRTPSQVSKKPAAPEFNKVAAADSKKEESRRNYEKAQEPAKTYKTPKGDERPVKARDPEVDYLRGRLDGERWASRPARYDTYYAPYAGRPVVLYSDPYAPFWHLQLMSMGTDVAAMWMFCHMSELDAARRDAMYAQNADLRARVAALERQGVKRDPTYVPKGVDPDLVYNDGFVNASYNPTPKTVEEYEYNDDRDSGGVPTWVVILVIVVVCGAVAFVIFVPRWNF